MFIQVLVQGKSHFRLIYLGAERLKCTSGQSDSSLFFMAQRYMYYDVCKINKNISILF